MTNGRGCDKDRVKPTSCVKALRGESIERSLFVFRGDRAYGGYCKLAKVHRILQSGRMGKEARERGRAAGW